MSESDTEFVRLTVTDDSSIDEAVIAFCSDGELVELASKRPPVAATLEAPDN